MGFLKRSSVASLVAGGGSGLSLAYGVHSRNHRLVTGELSSSLPHLSPLFRSFTLFELLQELLQFYSS